MHELRCGQLPIKHGVDGVHELRCGELYRCGVIVCDQLPGGLLPNLGVAGLHELRRWLLPGLYGCVELRVLPCRNLLCDYWSPCRHMCCRHLLICIGDRVLELRVWEMFRLDRLLRVLKLRGGLVPAKRWAIGLLRLTGGGGALLLCCTRRLQHHLRRCLWHLPSGGGWNDGENVLRHDDRRWGLDADVGL